MCSIFKVIDQTYSSLTTILQRQKANSLAIPQPPVSTRSEPLIPPPPKISPSNTNSTNNNLQTTTLDSTPQKHETLISSLTSGHDDFNGHQEIEGNTLRTPEPTTDGVAGLSDDNRNYAPSGTRLAKETSRKRKSISRPTQATSESQTTYEPAAKRRRVSKISPNTDSYPRARSLSQSCSPPECEGSHHSDTARVRTKPDFRETVLITFRRLTLPCQNPESVKKSLGRN
jgi:hypothetical protein